MNQGPSIKRRPMRRPAADDVVTVRYVLPSSLVTQTSAGLEVRTCKHGKITVPRSVLAGDTPSADKPHTVVIEAQMRRDLAQVVGDLVAEVARLTREVS